MVRPLFLVTKSFSTKTHNCYSEVQISEDGSWDARLISIDGDVKELISGKVSTKGKTYLEVRKVASKQAQKALGQFYKQYLK